MSDKDKGFRDKIMLELISILHSKQGWSMAWSAESHGDVERIHVEIHRVVGQTLMEIGSARGAEWPHYTPAVELVWRSKTLQTGESPMSLSRGFFAETSLQSVLGAINAVPHNIPHTTFGRALLAATRIANKHHQEYEADRKAILQAVRTERKGVRARTFEVGDCCMIARPTDVSEGHKLRARGFGLQRISAIEGDAVNLEDPFTGRPLLNDVSRLPDDINIDRFMRYNDNPESLIDTRENVTLQHLAVGTLVAFRKGGRVLLAEITESSDDSIVHGTVW